MTKVKFENGKWAAYCEFGYIGSFASEMLAWSAIRAAQAPKWLNESPDGI
jgi:hypothetical protein